MVCPCVREFPSDATAAGLRTLPQRSVLTLSVTQLTYVQLPLVYVSFLFNGCYGFCVPTGP